jgi:peptidoglycan/LPS O-acetylase OafA/YrhL
MDYRREIDGLRALAVLPVILFHAGFQTFSGGFVGVDVFFVISGYLITTIIIQELDKGTFSLVDFYERRARRILPALFLVMLVCIPFAWFWLLPSEMKQFSKSLVAVSIFASNVFFKRESGYFDTSVELKPLLHTWSLAVEEQYYVLFPLFMMVLWHIGKRRVLIILGLLFVTSLALAQYKLYEKPTSAFYLLPTRAWELLIGAFAAFYLSKSNRIEFSKDLAEVAGWLGLALIMCAIFGYSKTTPFPGLYALVPTLGAVLIILFATQQTAAGRFVGNKVFVAIGLISYSAYLWHQPLFAFARLRYLSELSSFVFILLIFLTFILAFYSWKYVEVNFRKKSFVTRKNIFILALFSSFFFISLGFIAKNNGFFEYRFSESQQYTLKTASPSPKRSECHFPQKESSLVKDACRYFSDNTKVAVLGNSHATELAYALANALKDKNVGIIQHTMSGCKHNYNIADESKTVCSRWHNKVFKELSADKSIEYVVLSYRNENLLGNEKYRFALANLANDLVDSGKKVVLVLQAPLPKAHINQYLRESMPDLSGSIKSRKLSDWNDLYSHSFELINQLRSEVVVFNPVNLFCDKQYCYVSIDGVALYFDDDHMSVSGAQFVAEYLVRQVFKW